MINISDPYISLIALSFLILPLLSFIILIFFGKRIGGKAHLVAMPFIGIMLVMATFMILNSIFYKPISINSAPLIFQNSISWIDTNSFKIDLGYYIDNITVIMLMVVSLISFLVHLYSTEYMRGDKRYSRYYAFLGIFTFSMNGIVLADSLAMIYIFWELVGLSSFLLIGFWFEKNSAASASKKAFLTNRVGDIGMFIGIMILFFNVGSFNINEIISNIGDMATNSPGLLSLAGILVFMGAIGKSAQFPLHIWLPDAMEGPTPVSALIHAATMVAAGVYMTVRIFPFLTPDALMFIAFIGAITALMAAIIAITQNDIKRVLAYSTVSQLGYMIMAIGVSAPMAAFFHLTTHAMFKACLFLASGSVIHAMHHSLHHLNDHDTAPQDMRNMGGLSKKMPITVFAMLITTLAIAGVPLFSGFLSKDMILAGSLTYYLDHGGMSILLPIAGFGAAIVTAFYMFRLIFLTFFGKPTNEEVHKHIHESPKVMTIPLILLSVLSVAFIFSFNPFDGSRHAYASKKDYDKDLNVSHNDGHTHQHSHKNHDKHHSADYKPIYKMPWFARMVPFGDEYDGYYSKGDGEWKESEKFYDKNQNGKYDIGELFVDKGKDDIKVVNYNVIDKHMMSHVEHEMHANHNLTMTISLIVATIGIAVSAIFYYFKLINVDSIASFLNRFRLYNLSLNKFYIDELYNIFIYKPFYLLTNIASKIDWDIYDQKIIDGWGWITLKISKYSGKGDFNILDQKIIDGSAHLTQFVSKKLRKTQSGVIQGYLMGVLVFVIVMVIIINQI